MSIHLLLLSLILAIFLSSELHIIIIEATQINEVLFLRLACFTGLCHLHSLIWSHTGPPASLLADNPLFLLVVECPIVLFKGNSDAAILILLTLGALAHTFRSALPLVAVLT